jgi:hypothetical protein
MISDAQGKIHASFGDLLSTNAAADHLVVKVVSAAEVLGHMENVLPSLQPTGEAR